MSLAQPRSWLGEAGLQVKIRRRLGVSETPVMVIGPATASS
jgi:hypothetical protein